MVATLVACLDELAVRALIRLFFDVRLGAAFLPMAVFDAFWARAFPAGERLVAGFKRVDFTLTVRFRAFDALREDVLFVVLLTVLLMLSAHHSYTQIPREPTRSLTQLHL